LADKQADQIFQQDVAIALAGRQTKEADRRGAEGQEGEPRRLAALGWSQPNAHVQRFVDQQREFVLGVHRHRRVDREDLAVEDLLHHGFLILRQLLGRDALDSRPCQPRFQLVQQAPVLVGHHLMRPLADGFQLLGGRHPGGVAFRAPLLAQHLQPADADHDEFVQVRAGDGQEFQTLQQRQPLVRRFVQDALVEFEPAELAIEEFGGGEGFGHRE
jgi:hypothetical protein